MLAKDRSLARHPGFEDYRKSSGLLFPRLFSDLQARALTSCHCAPPPIVRARALFVSQTLTAAPLLGCDKARSQAGPKPILRPRDIDPGSGGNRLEWHECPVQADVVQPMSEVTRILSAIEQGDPQAAEQLLPLVYAELRRLATQKLAREKPGQTLDATALVHEAYVRLVDVENAQHWNSRGHFFAAAAEAMRRILVDQARQKQSQRRGGGRKRRPLEQVEIAAAEPTQDMLALNEALERFEQIDPVKAELVKLRYFAGLSLLQAAEALGISRTTADRYWSYARAWLHAELKKGTS